MRDKRPYIIAAVFCLATIVSHLWLVGLPNISLPSLNRASVVVYYYEKDMGGLPAWVAGYVRALNEEGDVVGLVVEIDTVDGLDEIPDLLRPAFDAVQTLPAFVALAEDGSIVSILENPRDRGDAERWL